uniref:Uncharacterized protein n=1 Tax=Anguilla anguilla TaxID=7936 RepID=A0A0E9TQX3_ANGAN
MKCCFRANLMIRYRDS